jgi:hypothetical protein
VKSAVNLLWRGPSDQSVATERGVRAAFFLINVATECPIRIVAMIEAGSLRTLVGAVLPLAAARPAHEMLGKPTAAAPQNLASDARMITALRLAGRRLTPSPIILESQSRTDACNLRADFPNLLIRAAWIGAGPQSRSTTMSFRSLTSAAEHPPVRIALAIVGAFALLLITLLAVRPEMMMSVVHAMMPGL